MKKFLSLLSILTISGTIMPIIIAISPYQKQEKKENIKNNIKKRNNSEFNNINRTKIVITTNGEIPTGGIIFNNKLYFGSLDNNIYEYDPVTEQQKIVITTGGQIWSSGVLFNKKLYFGSWDHNVYEYDPVTEQQKIVIRTNSWVASSGVVLNNKIYFGSGDKNVYEYDPVTEQQKIATKTNGSIKSSGIIFNNKLYFGSQDKNVYEYDPITEKQKIVIRTEKADFFWSSGVILNNKIYFGSDDGNVYEYDPVTEQQKIVIRTNSWIESAGLVLNNKIYFGSYDHNVYEYDPITEKQKIVIRTNGEIWCSGVVFNNKLYFGSWDHNVYEYDPITEQQKIIVRTKNKISSSGIVLNNKLYFGSGDKNVYEYDPNYYNLSEINNNSDNVILNEFNYLNPNLDISQLEIINKTNNLAIVKEKNNLNNNKYKIYYLINDNNQQNKIINLNELIKKSIFFKFRNENNNLNFKEINYINTNNLNFSNIEVTRYSELIYNVDFKDACFKKKTFTNISLKETQKRKIPKCQYNTKSKLLFQILTKFVKTNQENKITGWNINVDDELKLSDFLNINSKNSKFINILSDSFDLSNKNKQEQEIILQSFNENDYEILIDPKTKLEIKYSVRKINIETILNLKQKINGNITIKIINDNNKEQIIIFSIKEAMQILKNYNLLPYEITINEENNIIFNGKAKINLIQESEPELITKISQI